MRRGKSGSVFDSGQGIKNGYSLVDKVTKVYVDGAPPVMRMVPPEEMNAREEEDAARCVPWEK